MNENVKIVYRAYFRRKWIDLQHVPSRDGLHYDANHCCLFVFHVTLNDTIQRPSGRRPFHTCPCPLFMHFADWWCDVERVCWTVLVDTEVLTLHWRGVRVIWGRALHWTSHDQHSTTLGTQHDSSVVLREVYSNKPLPVARDDPSLYIYKVLLQDSVSVAYFATTYLNFFIRNLRWHLHCKGSYYLVCMSAGDFFVCRMFLRQTNFLS